jgi:hypothetical protein
MKCPKCSNKQRRGKEGMVCKSCSYEFVFDPKVDTINPSTPLHDHLFKKIINHASANETYHFTENQFYSSARHFGQASLLGCAIVFFAAIALFLAGVIFQITPAALLGGFFLFVISIGTTVNFLRGKGPKRKHWDRLVRKWLKYEHQIRGLITSPALTRPPPQWQEKDIYDYGVSGIILCDRPETVDWLVYNQFHTQTNTLILTAEGYPTYLINLAESLLADTPDLPVWLLHDPGTAPESMKRKCTLPITQFIDLGLDSETLSRLTILKKRFSSRDRATLALDAIPYRTLSAALTHCIATGVLLGSILGANATDSDTDTSFG